MQAVREDKDASQIEEPLFIFVEPLYIYFFVYFCKVPEIYVCFAYTIRPLQIQRQSQIKPSHYLTR